MSDKCDRSLDGKSWRFTLEIITWGLFETLTENILEFLRKKKKKKKKIEGDISYHRHFLHPSYEGVIPGR